MGFDTFGFAGDEGIGITGEAAGHGFSQWQSSCSAGSSSTIGTKAERRPRCRRGGGGGDSVAASPPTGDGGEEDGSAMGQGELEV